ncbi:hypothetical protein KQ939_16315 [Planococcus sp. CP5-4]|uniref:hypothetical protein n=1 Tax=unclassified Planococcus (in: firmicutes) TaxID=2662419 RepID=UPI001C2142AD|nr:MULTISPECIES: hypothetical protein [unclassified Planococcus (in: firmicutes)]MBU9673888.1 hypothetical protein [Planococcus sp. CP5-4_YE]MBV0909758.1 hypothetical protein [Planococcus sp. CP5-4_UN]MBW6065242.1 hypothetical protein [Planococcus sp. CP5-4]
MKLFWAMLFSSILGYILLMFGPLYGGILAFGILFGCMFRGLYLLSQIHQKISQATIEKTQLPQEAQRII